MNSYQKSLIDEHAQLVTRTTRLHNYIFIEEPTKTGHTVKDDDRVEFANKCIQLSAMKKYEEALRARLENAGVVFENGDYFERVATINVPNTAESFGSDYDADAEKESTDE